MRMESGRGARAVPSRQRSGVAGPPAWARVTQVERRWSGTGPCVDVRNKGKTDCSRGHPPGHPDASSTISLLMLRCLRELTPSVTHRQRVRLHQLDAPRQARSDRAPTLCRSAGELCFNFQSDHGGQEVLIEDHHSCNRIRCALWI